VRRLQPDSVRISAVCVACPHPAHNNVAVSLVTVTRPPVRIALAVNPAAAAPPRRVCPRCVCPRTALRCCVPRHQPPTASVVLPPNMLRTAMLCPLKMALPVVCPRCVSPVVCPRCLSPHCPSGVSPMAWLWCCCNRYSRSMRGPGSVPCEFQSATPVMCPPVMQSLRPERAGLGLSVSRAPECRPSGVSPAACPPTSSVVPPPRCCGPRCCVP